MTDDTTGQLSQLTYAELCDETNSKFAHVILAALRNEGDKARSLSGLIKVAGIKPPSFHRQCKTDPALAEIKRRIKRSYEVQREEDKATKQQIAKATGPLVWVDSTGKIVPPPDEDEPAFTHDGVPVYRTHNYKLVPLREPANVGLDKIAKRLKRIEERLAKIEVRLER